jgi:hypothetical protein
MGLEELHKRKPVSVHGSLSGPKPRPRPQQPRRRETRFVLGTAAPSYGPGASLCGADRPGKHGSAPRAGLDEIMPGQPWKRVPGLRARRGRSTGRSGGGHRFVPSQLDGSRHWEVDPGSCGQRRRETKTGICTAWSCRSSSSQRVMEASLWARLRRELLNNRIPVQVGRAKSPSAS